jgi:hypothetical protein
MKRVYESGEIVENWEWLNLNRWRILSGFPRLEYDDPLRAQPTLGTTMEHAQVATTSRERYMRAAQTELAKFERHEIEFRKKDQQERAAELDLPLPSGKQH